MRTGPENYSYEIIRALIKLDKTNTFKLYTPNLPKESWEIPKNVEWCILPQQRLWTQIRLARELKLNPPDVLFVPSHVVPVLSNLPTVCTIHDLAYKFFPNSYSSFDRRYLNFGTSVSASKSKTILVPSESTKSDLIKEYGVDKRRIVVTYEGYNKEVFNTRMKYGEPPLNNDYFIFVGRIEEKKNIRLLIDAFSQLARHNTSVGLVLSGKNGYGYEKIREKIDHLPHSIKNRIVQPGYLPKYDMLRYLQHAKAFVFPSWYEGFGLSVLEAMALGIPVICSNTSSLPEVTGTSAILLNPTDSRSWTENMQKLINEPKIRQTMREKGVKQAAKFTWEKTAKITLEAINGVV